MSTSQEPSSDATSHEGVVFDPTEKSLGIKAYLSPHVPGFSAVSKGRYSDFVVHEGR